MTTATVKLKKPAVTSAVELKLREDLAAAYRLVAMYGWDDLLFTHLSARIPGPDHHFLLNPFGLMFEEVTASSLVKVDLDGNLIDPGAGRINPAGFTIHSAVHAAREDAQCVIHLHTVAGVGVSCQKHGLLPMHQAAMLFQANLAYHDYEGVAFDHDERPRLVADLGDADYMILRNHGTLAVGRSIGEAFQRIYNLERSCQMQIAAMSGGAELNQPSEHAQAVTLRQSVNQPQWVSDDYVWPALIRRLDRAGSDFRN